MPPKRGGKRAKREPVRDEEEAELEEFPVHAGDGYEVPLVCRSVDEYYSVMGVLFWSHYNSLEAGITRFFDTKGACVLRLVHSESRDAVSATPWRDLRTVIKGSVASWRECFGLRAQAASVRGRRDLVDADFVHFRGLAALDMSFTSGFTDNAYANLCGIDCLQMVGHDLDFGTEVVSHIRGVQEIETLCDRTDATAAYSRLQGVRSIAFSSRQNRLYPALAAGDAAECRHLLESRAVEGATWFYAGVSFRAPSTASSPEVVIASAGLELLQVGVDAESACIVIEAARAFTCFASASEETSASCATLGVVAALVNALKMRFCSVDAMASYYVCETLELIASTSIGRAACVTANAIPILVPLLKFHLDLISPPISATVCTLLASMLQTEGGTASCILAGGVPHIVAALRIHAGADRVCANATRALRIISRSPDGVVACVSADAAPYLMAVYEMHPTARKDAKIALKHLGWVVEPDK